jgi:AraC family transcriptional regulator
MHHSHNDDTRAIIRADGNYFGTVRRRFVVDGLHMSETAYAAGARIPTHRHECPSFFMPLGGAFVEGCGNVVRRYATGDVGYHPPHEPHWLHTHGNAACGFAIEVGAEWRTTLGDTTAWDSAPRDLSRSRVSWLIGRLFLELHTYDAARPLIVQGLGVEIGAELSRELSRERLRRARARPGWLLRLCEQLHDQPIETPSLRELAAVAGVTPAGMIKAFRRHEGCTPGEYLRALRFARARTALGGSDRPLGAIALDAGFYDHSHFTREFRRIMGVTPLGYRQALRGGASRLTS